MGAALPIRDELTPEALRRHARGEPNRRAALRTLAIANALEGMSRAEAARLAGMERQALRDAVVRYNAEGIAGLHDRPKSGRPQRLSEAEQAALMARVFRGPDPERDGVSARTLAGSSEGCGGLRSASGLLPRSLPLRDRSTARGLGGCGRHGVRPGHSVRPWRPTLAEGDTPIASGAWPPSWLREPAVRNNAATLTLAGLASPYAGATMRSRSAIRLSTKASA